MCRQTDRQTDMLIVMLYTHTGRSKKDSDANAYITGGQFLSSGILLWSYRYSVLAGSPKRELVDNWIRFLQAVDVLFVTQQTLSGH